MSESTKVKSRELSKRETREALIQAGMAAFSEGGVDLPSLDAICVRAGFTRGAFYVHFKDRDEFLEAIVERVLVGFVNFVIPGSSAGDVPRTIDRFLLAAAQGRVPMQGNRHLINQLMTRGLQRSERMQERYRVLLTDALERLSQAAEAGQREGQLRSELDSDMLALILVAGALGLTQLLDAGVDLDLQRARKNLIRLLQTDPE